LSKQVSLGGTNFTVPDVSDAWTQSMSDFCKQITITPFFTSPTTNPSQSGYIRLATTDGIGWRNNANNADLLLAKDTLDRLTYAGNVISGGAPYLEVTMNTGMSIANATTTIVLFNTIVTDTDLGYSTSTGRYTIPANKGGKWMLVSTVEWGVGAGAGAVLMQMDLYINAGLGTTLDNEGLTPGTTFAVNNALTGVAVFGANAGDVIDVRVTQNSGGAMTLTNSAARNRMTFLKLPI